MGANFENLNKVGKTYILKFELSDISFTYQGDSLLQCFKFLSISNYQEDYVVTSHGIFSIL